MNIPDTLLKQVRILICKNIRSDQCGLLRENGIMTYTCDDCVREFMKEAERLIGGVDGLK